MKHELSAKPEIMKGSWERQFEVFSWIEFISSIPQSMSIITTYKEGQIPNACLQAWTTYTGDAGGFYAIMSMLKNNHTFHNILRDKEFAVNFPSQDFLKECARTIEHFSDETDEIAASGLTMEPSIKIRTPRIKECFLNLECRLEWERPLHEDSRWHIFAGQVVHTAIDTEHARERKYYRYGHGGFIFNIHSPIDPATGYEDPTMMGIIEPVKVL